MPFQHLEDIKTSYCDHFNHAILLVVRLTKNVGKLVIHAIYPDVFVTDVTEDLKDMLQEHEAWTK